MDMRLGSPAVLFLLLVLPVLAWCLWRRKGGGTIRFSTTANARRAGRSLRQRLVFLPELLRLLTLVLVIFALARPQQGRERIHDVSKGIAIEMVVDRSGSMGAEMEYQGQRLTRLETVKRVFEAFVSGDGRSLKGRPNDLIGMIAFARYPDTVCPLTLAHGALSHFLENVRMVPQRSNENATGIGDAVALAAARLKTAEETLAQQTQEDTSKTYEIKSKVIILLTDGEQNCGKRTMEEAGKLAAEWGIKVHTIGVGGRDGVMQSQTIIGSLLHRMGGSGVDEEALKALADATGGIYRLARDAKSLRSVYEEIDEMERSEIETVRYMDYREAFTPFVVLALAFLFLEVVLRCTVFRRIP
ncbi:MAG: VWA domain-containing protein [Lentisphaerae bacterium]|jgi:Ca-activated chloride channel homolog|nr:VWA domain-containing protein [Lentisphaerota bacterium]MBT4816746.1 VWA domain-containing protein [Lentisphaerota bacterium]MBT5606095.1 VWA domain-containing protein [Lentisphaerota bacterium]MBT7058543.1 VWA domain-containing protein [Lentisphaerota bacterium]MBT7845777.1 VWA domain-containing protein [Lentisphaerota bacterium]